MKTPQIAIASCDDYQALYIDGKKVCENHTLGVHDLLNALGLKSEYVDVVQEWAEEHGFPENFSDLL